MHAHVIGVGFLSLLFLGPVNSWAHAYLVKSVPARRAVLSQAPARVQLWFNERLEARFCQLSVWHANGQQMDRGDVEVSADDPKKLSVGLQTLALGTYTVKFRVLSVDGHIAESQFPFTVRRGQ